jgi:hypothetical protein
MAPTANAALVEISAMRVRRMRSFTSSRSCSNQTSREGVWLGAVVMIDGGGDGVASTLPVVWLSWAEAGPAVQTTTAKMRVAANDARLMGRR